MASLTVSKTGLAAVYVKLRCGARKSVRLGRMTRRRAEPIRDHLAELEAAALTGSTPPPETRRWAEATKGDLRDRMVAAGLIEPAEVREVATLKAFGDVWLKWKAATVKPSTLTRARNAPMNLIELFGPEKPMQSFTAGDGDDWRAYMIGGRASRLAEATVRRRTADARDLFAYAIRKGAYTGDNPFGHLPTGDVVDPDRQVHIPEEDSRRVLAELQGRGQLPTRELRTVFVLSRWGGLRIPSELQGLTWRDIDWAAGRVTIKSPKTEHLPRGDRRVMPLFPELRAILQEAFDHAEPGSVYVCPYARTNTGAALRQPVLDAMERAGVTRWPKLWHQNRSSRQTDLSNAHPEGVVCKWLGNTPKVARAHYLTATDEHFTAAATGPARLEPEPRPAPAGAPDAGCDPEAVRKAVRTGSAGDRTGPAEPPLEGREPHLTACNPYQVARAGLEPATPAFSMLCSTN